MQPLKTPTTSTTTKPDQTEKQQKPIKNIISLRSLKKIFSEKSDHKQQPKTIYNITVILLYNKYLCEAW